MSNAERKQLYQQILIATATMPFMFGRRATEAEAKLIDSLLEMQESDESLASSDKMLSQYCEVR